MTGHPLGRWHSRLMVEMVKATSTRYSARPPVDALPCRHQQYGSIYQNLGGYCRLPGSSDMGDLCRQSERDAEHHHAHYQITNLRSLSMTKPQKRKPFALSPLPKAGALLIVITKLFGTERSRKIVEYLRHKDLCLSLLALTNKTDTYYMLLTSSMTHQNAISMPPPAVITDQ